MKKSRFTEEQIAFALRQAEVEFGKGRKVTEVCKTLGIHQVMYYRWRREYTLHRPARMRKNTSDSGHGAPASVTAR